MNYKLPTAEEVAKSLIEDDLIDASEDDIREAADYVFWCNNNRPKLTEEEREEYQGWLEEFDTNAVYRVLEQHPQDYCSVIHFRGMSEKEVRDFITDLEQQYNNIDINDCLEIDD